MTAISLGVYSVFHLPGRPCCDCGQQSTGPSRARQLRTGCAAIFWSRMAVLTQHFLSQWEQISHISSKDMRTLLSTIRTRNTPRRHVTCRSAQCVSLDVTLSTVIPQVTFWSPTQADYQLIFDVYSGSSVTYYIPIPTCATRPNPATGAILFLGLDGRHPRAQSAC